MPLVGPFVDTSVPASQIWDTIAPTPGTIPVSTPPNAYLVGDDHRVIQGTMAGPPIDVWAVPWTGNGNQTVVGVMVDGVYFTTLNFSGTQGIKAKQTLTVDGAPHAITLIQSATVTNIVGAFTAQTAAAPSVRVVVDGDSKAYGINSTILPKFAWPVQLRGLLPAGYRVTDWGTSGKTMGFHGGDGTLIAQRCDGVSKNIAVVALDINDFIQGVTISTFTTAVNGLIASTQAAVPGVKILFANSPQTFATPILGGGVTQANIQSILTTAAAADPTRVFFTDCLTTLFPGGSPWATDYAPDGVHFTDHGMGLMAARINSVVITL